ncbi:hypothetical protein D3C73_1124770 [compost metagenome]
MRKGSGAWGKIAMISTATAAPRVVPMTWPKLRASTMPPRGWLMMTTAMIDHLGCSRSNINARYSVNSPAAMVRRANSSTPRPGLSIALKYCSSACMGPPVQSTPASVVTEARSGQVSQSGFDSRSCLTEADSFAKACQLPDSACPSPAVICSSASASCLPLALPGCSCAAAPPWCPKRSSAVTAKR